MTYSFGHPVHAGVILSVMSVVSWNVHCPCEPYSDIWQAREYVWYPQFFSHILLVWRPIIVITVKAVLYQCIVYFIERLAWRCFDNVVFDKCTGVEDGCQTILLFVSKLHLMLRRSICFNGSFGAGALLHRVGCGSNFCRAMLCISARPCGVCLCVTFVHSVKTNKHIFKFFSPSGSQAILVF